MQPNSKSPRTVITLALLLALPVALCASGTYTARPPRPAAPGQAQKMDSAKYDLGKRIYNGKATLTAAPAPAGAEARLAALQARLPAGEQKKTNLPALGGKLTAEQLDALEYYVGQRFPQK